MAAGAAKESIMGTGGTLIKMLQEVPAAGWAYINIQPTTILWDGPCTPKRANRQPLTHRNRVLPLYDV